MSIGRFVDLAEEEVIACDGKSFFILFIASSLRSKTHNCSLLQVPARCVAEAGRRMRTNM